MTLTVSRIKIYQFIRFAFVGVINTVLDLIVLNALVYIFKVDNPFVFSICKALSFAIAVTNSYFMNKYFTFAKKQSSGKDFYLFIIISLIGLVINISISSAAFYLLGLYPNIVSVNLIATISGAVGAVFSMVINYLCYSYFVFK